MIYKRATAKLRSAGIADIVIVKRLWGASPQYPKARRQQSQCFATPTLAVDAVLGGFRPTIIDEIEESK